jgi:4-alpha-glucanotransferase
MRILQFAFGGDTDNHDLPHNYLKNCVAYTGTHDNDTTVGWFNSRAGSGSTRDADQIRREREFCLNYLKSDGEEIHWDFVRAVWESVADTAIAPMQDLLGLGNEARMNLPASSSGNWYWQCREGDFSKEIAERLRRLTEIYGRKIS